jgi:hypothetical protein
VTRVFSSTQGVLSSLLLTELTRLSTNRTILWRLKTILGFIRLDLSDFLLKSPHTESVCGMKKLQVSAQKLLWVTGSLGKLGIDSGHHTSQARKHVNLRTSL